jgi:hypothetical protein
LSSFGLSSFLDCRLLGLAQGFSPAKTAAKIGALAPGLLS